MFQNNTDTIQRTLVKARPSRSSARTGSWSILSEPTTVGFPSLSAMTMATRSGVSTACLPSHSGFCIASKLVLYFWSISKLVKSPQLSWFCVYLYNQRVPIGLFWVNFKLYIRLKTKKISCYKISPLFTYRYFKSFKPFIQCY